MGKDYKMLSFGRYLQAIRLEKGINLDDISAETRIGIEMLEAIEKEDHDRLPADVFLKGFLRAYAKAVGADGDEAIKRYLSSICDVQKVAEIDTSLKNSDSKFWLRLALSIGLFALLVGLSIFIISLPEKEAPPLPPKLPALEKKADVLVVKEPPPVVKKAAEPSGPATPKTSELKKENKQSRPAIPKKLSLKVVTLKTTWLKVIADNNNSNEYSLYPGDILELEADQGFNLLVGNAAGVHLFLNEKPVKIAGSIGQVVNIQIP